MRAFHWLSLGVGSLLASSVILACGSSSSDSSSAAKADSGAAASEADGGSSVNLFNVQCDYATPDGVSGNLPYGVATCDNEGTGYYCQADGGITKVAGCVPGGDSGLAYTITACAGAANSVTKGFGTCDPFTQYCLANGTGGSNECFAFPTTCNSCECLNAMCPQGPSSIAACNQSGPSVNALCGSQSL